MFSRNKQNPRKLQPILSQPLDDQNKETFCGLFILYQDIHLKTPTKSEPEGALYYKIMK